MKLKLVIFLSFIFSNFSFCQSEKSNLSDSIAWESLKIVAHEIGFCIYHSSEKHCAEHSGELTKREKTASPDLEVFYFEMKKEWAEKRLTEWSKRQEQPVENFLILFDVAQSKPSEETETETFNLFRGFVLIDLTDTIDFVFLEKKQARNKMAIKSDGQNALMENVLWREFMTGRLGRFSNHIEFGLIGKNAETDFEKFKKAFLIFQKVNNNKK